MKKGWQRKRLGELCALDKAQGVHRDLPYVGLEHIESNTGRFTGSLDPQTVKSSTFRFSSEHVLYGRLRPYLNKAFAPNFVGHCSTEIFPIKPTPTLSREYLLYWLLMDKTMQRINETCTGARMPRANMNEVLDFELPLPPLSEQRRIVGMLDEAFAGLAIAQAKAEKNFQNASSLFEGCLRDEIGEVVKLGELVDIRTGKLDANAAVEKGKYPFFTCSREIYAIDNYAFDCDAVLLAGNNAVGDFNVKHFIGKFNAYQRTYVLTVNQKNRALCRYVYYQLQKNLTKFKSQSVGAGTKFLKLGMIKDMRVPLPSLAEQARIVEKLDALTTKTQRLTQLYEQKLAALAALKKSLLHQVFTGEL